MLTISFNLSPSFFIPAYILLSLLFLSLLNLFPNEVNQNSLSKRLAWHQNQPEYRILGIKDEPNSQENLLSEWSRPTSGYNGARLQAFPLESLQQVTRSEPIREPLDYYLDQAKNYDLLQSNENNRQQQQLYQELALTNLINSKQGQKQSSLLDDNIAQSRGFDYQTLSNSDLSSNVDYEQPNFNSGQFLAELLQANNNKRVSPSSDQTNQQPFDLATNFDLKYNSKSPLNHSPDQSILSSSSSSSESSKVNSYDRVNQEDAVNDGSQENRVYDNSDNVRKDQKQHKEDESPIKFTTLLEDEEVEKSDLKNSSSPASPSSSSSSLSSSDIKSTGSKQVETNDNRNNKLSTALPSEGQNKISYGTVINNANTTSGYTLTSMLSGMYNKFANLLPQFSFGASKENERTATMASKRDSYLSRNEDNSSKITYGSVAENKNDSKSSISSMLKNVYNKISSYLTLKDQHPIINKNSESTGVSIKPESLDDDPSNVDSNRPNTKQSVSKSGQIELADSDEDNHEDSGEKSKLKINSDDKQTTKDRKQQVSKSSVDKESNDDDFLDSEFKQPILGANIDDDSDDDNRSKSDDIKPLKDNMNDTNGSDSMSFDKMMPIINGDSGDHKVSLLRRSKLIMPLRSNDDQQVVNSDEFGNNDHTVSLLGYYTPERHYILNRNNQFDTTPQLRVTSDKNLDMNGQEQRQVYSQSSHRSYSHRIHPGDDVYSSYSELRPIYTTHGGRHEALSLVPNNKANDMYFLIMVSAFCIMAMAVVLAAGLFAYRVQQNRKLTAETDYPTYGVVGPNSMNTKCGGAAGFVGGYFGSIKGPSSSSSDSKTNSTKHLADIYSGSDSGIITSCKQSGGSKRSINDPQTNTGSNPLGGPNNRSDFLANQNAARMYHYQHQKQQMIISDRSSNGRQTSASDLDSDDENDDGSYTVYECPGLASAHEMEIKNPLFNDDQTP